MNCRPGDLAVVVRSIAGNEGRLVVVAEFLGTVDYAITGPEPNCWAISPVGGPLNAFPGCDEPDSAPDTSLRPIRDGNGDDETFSWAGKPVKETA